jgi:hypothetical protein
MVRMLRPCLARAALALAVVLAASPALAQGSDAARRAAGSSSVEQEFSLLNADRAYRLGRFQFETRQYEAAVSQLEQAVSLAPWVDVYRRSLAVARQRLAEEQAQQRTIQESLTRARRSLGKDTPALAIPNTMGPRGLSGDPTRQGVGANPMSEGDVDMVLRPYEVRELARRTTGASGLPNDLPIAGPDGDVPMLRDRDAAAAVRKNPDEGGDDPLHERGESDKSESILPPALREPSAAPSLDSPVPLP